MRLPADRALRDIRGFASAGRVVFSRHARERMAQRGSDVANVLHALSRATTCRPSERGRWHVEGTDLDGDAIAVVVALESGVVVVTMF